MRRDCGGQTCLSAPKADRSPEYAGWKSKHGSKFSVFAAELRRYFSQLIVWRDQMARDLPPASITPLCRNSRYTVFRETRKFCATLEIFPWLFL